MEGLAGLLPFILLIGVFWFLIVAPQRRRQKELARTQNELGPGAEVMLGSGIFGTVVSVEDDQVRLEVAPGTTLRVARQAVVRVLTGAPGSDAETDQTGTTGQTGSTGTSGSTGSTGTTDEQ